VVVGCSATPVTTRLASSHCEVNALFIGHSGLEYRYTVTVVFDATASIDISRQADPDPVAIGL
jgi:hypothetical protein